MSPPYLVYHQDYLTSYYTSTVRCPARVKAIYATLAKRFPTVEAEPAKREDILTVHTSISGDFRLEILDLRAESLGSVKAAGSICNLQLKPGTRPQGGSPQDKPIILTLFLRVH
jgi:hypothetical protein